MSESTFNARATDLKTSYFQSLALNGVGVNSVNPSCDTNISPTTGGTGPGRYVVQSNPVFGGETYDFNPLPSWYPPVDNVVRIDDSTFTLGDSVRAEIAAGAVSGTGLGVNDPDDIVEPWCGGAILTLYGRPYLVIYGGGHFDSYYNGIHKFGPLDSNSPVWSVFLEASRVADYTDAEVYLDGRQSSNHTYNHLVGVAGALYCMNTSARANQAGTSTPGCFKFTSEGATVVGQTQLEDNPRLQAFGCAAEYNGKIYYRGGNNSSDRLYVYDIASDSWAQSGDISTYFENYPAMAIDTSRGALLVVGNPDSHYYDDVTTLVRRTGIPTPPTIGNTLPANNNTHFNCVEYDAGRDTFVSMYENNVVYELDASVLAAGGTPSWTTRTFSGVSWPAKSARGVYGRFRYIPSLNGFIIMPGPDVDGGVYFARST
jgi:hypothetical protein